MDESKKEHELKTWPVPFQAMWHGDKLYEIRKNDRNFAVGDKLILREWDSANEYSGFAIIGMVTYMTKGGEWGLPLDLCVLSVRVIEKIGNNYQPS